MNLVLSPAPMLKLCQLMYALSEVRIVNCGPEFANVALPCTTWPPTGFALARNCPTQLSVSDIRTAIRRQRTGRAKGMVIASRLSSVELQKKISEVTIV